MNIIKELVLQAKFLWNFKCSNTAVDYRFFEKHAYHALTPGQNNTLRVKCLKRGHVGNGHDGNGNGTVKCNGKGPMIKSLTCSIAALATKFDKFSLPDDDNDESSEEEECTSNLSNYALTRQSKKKNKRDRN
jgi:hypothetical protein